MNKKFVFVHLAIECAYNLPNHGIAFLAPIAKKYSYDTTCLYISEEINSQEFVNKVKTLNPSIVGFSCTTHQLKYLAKYSTALKYSSKALQIAGGVGATLDPEWVLSRSAIDGVCIGEGEIPFDKLLNNIHNAQDFYTTKGFWWRTNSGIKTNRIPEFISDLSHLEFPDYSIFKRNVVSHKGVIFVMLTRGCPFSCFYCCNKSLSNIYPSSKGYFRVPSVKFAITLLERMIKQFPETNFIEFEDDLLIANKQWFTDFSEVYRKRINKPYRACVRVEYVSAEIAAILKQSGCRKVFLGVESGNEELRQNILNRRHSNEAIIDKCNILKEAGLEVFTFNIVGFPFEKKEMMRDTLNLNKKIDPNDGVCFFFYPYKGTELYNICARNNLLKSNDELLKIHNYITKPAIKMTASQEKECIYFYRRINKYLYKQRGLTEASHYLPGIKRFLITLHYHIAAVARGMPVLFKIYMYLKRLRSKSVNLFLIC